MKKSIKILIIIIVTFIACLCLGLFYYLIVKNPINLNSVKQTNKEEIVVDNDVITNEVIDNEDTEKEDMEEHIDKNYALITKDVYINGQVLSKNQTDLNVYEYHDLKEYDEILYSFRGYSTDPSFKYVITVKDNNDNEILIDEASQGMGNVIVAKIQNVTLEQTLTFTVTEILDNESQEITKIIETTINLNEDIEEIQKIDQVSNVTERILGDIKFKYINDEAANSWPKAHAYSKNLTGELFSSSIGVQYGNVLLKEEHFDFSYEKNVNNLKLNEAFESIKLITEKAGEYGLSDVYGLYICDDEGEILDTIEVSFEEMLKLCNGEEIDVAGVKYNSESFDFTSGVEYIKVDEIKIAGLDAIKYHSKNNETCYYYLFEYNGNIYKISLPNHDKLEEEVEFILNNIEIAK